MLMLGALLRLGALRRVSKHEAQPHGEEPELSFETLASLVPQDEVGPRTTGAALPPFETRARSAAKFYAGCASLPACVLLWVRAE